MIEESQKFNEQIREWNSRNYREIKNRYMGLVNSPNRSGDGLESLRYKLFYRSGEIDRLGYTFNRYLVFLHKGVGKGRPVGSNKIKPKEWLNPVMDSNVPELADLVADLRADAVLNKIQIK